MKISNTSIKKFLKNLKNIKEKTPPLLAIPTPLFSIFFFYPQELISILPNTIKNTFNCQKGLNAFGC